MPEMFELADVSTSEASAIRLQKVWQCMAQGGVRMLISNRYFKEQPDGSWLMSGLPLPKDRDGVVRAVDFAFCEFHPNCGMVVFENCTFDHCSGIEHLHQVVKS